MIGSKVSAKCRPGVATFGKQFGDGDERGNGTGPKEIDGVQVCRRVRERKWIALDVIVVPARRFPVRSRMAAG